MTVSEKRWDHHDQLMRQHEHNAHLGRIAHAKSNMNAIYYSKTATLEAKNLASRITALLHELHQDVFNYRVDNNEVVDIGQRRKDRYAKEEDKKARQRAKETGSQMES